MGKGKGKGKGKVVRRPFVDDLMEPQTFYASAKKEKKNYNHPSKASIATYTQYVSYVLPVQCPPSFATIKI